MKIIFRCFFFKKFLSLFVLMILFAMYSFDRTLEFSDVPPTQPTLIYPSPKDRAISLRPTFQLNGRSGVTQTPKLIWGKNTFFTLIQYRKVTMNK